MNNKTLVFLVFFIVIFLATNYFPKETLAEEMNMIQKSEDVVVVSNPKIPVLKNGFKIRIVFKEELSIGEVKGDENYMFGNLVFFNTDEVGNFYVTDWDRKRVQKYDSQGKYLITIGREGQGPGEFQNLSIPRFDKDNNIYFLDVASLRISFFDKDGRFLRQIKVPSVFERLYINSINYFIAQQSKVLEDSDVFKYALIYGLFDDKFNPIVEFHRETRERKAPAGRDEKSIAEFLAYGLSEYAFKSFINYIIDKNDYIYFGNPEKYEIHIYSPEGKLIKKIMREYEPIKVTKKDKEHFVRTWGEAFFRALPPRAAALKKKAFKLITYPQYKPAYLSFTLMENGWLLVVIDSIENKYALIDIFNKEGRYIAQFKAKIPAENLFFKNGKAYALAAGNGYKFVKRYNFEIQEYRDNRWVRKNN